ncbi:MAG: crotonase/enoyl-CoA hydratase family protein [Pseudomonadota bacterium]
MSATLDMQGKVAVIRMDDGKVNAINFDRLNELNDAMDKAMDDAGAVVIAGRDGVFSGGFDLKIMRGAPLEEINRLVNEGAKFLHRLLTSDRPIVGASTGHGMAMGLFTLMACDYRVGAQGAFQYGANETAIGMPLPVFGFELAKIRMTPAAFARSVALSVPFNPDSAKDAGVLDEVVAPEKVLEVAIAHAEQFAAYPREAFSFNKAGVNTGAVETIAANIV